MFHGRSTTPRLASLNFFIYFIWNYRLSTTNAWGRIAASKMSATYPGWALSGINTSGLDFRDCDIPMIVRVIVFRFNRFSPYSGQQFLLRWLCYTTTKRGVLFLKFPPVMRVCCVCEAAQRRLPTPSPSPPPPFAAVCCLRPLSWKIFPSSLSL